MPDGLSMFCLTVDPVAAELERFRMPSLDEVPGSAADRRMRREHDRKRVALGIPQASLTETRRGFVESRKTVPVGPTGFTDKQMAIAIAAANNKQGK